MTRRSIAVCLIAVTFPACLEDQRGSHADTTGQPADSASDTSTPGQPDTNLPGPSGTVRLTARLLGAFHTEACIDVAVDNGITTIWRKGDPTTTLSGGDQRLEPWQRVAGQGALDTETTCLTSIVTGEAAVFELDAPCDATRDTAPDRAGIQNELTLWVDDLRLLERDRTLMPCPDGCTMTFDCNVDTRTALSFDGAVVFRDAAQGFAETADIIDSAWCTAKYDSCLNLLFDEAGNRVETGVMAVACSGGTAATVVELGRVAFVCDTHRFDLQPTKLGPAEATSNGARLGFATFAGAEPFYEGLVKQYFNLAFRMPDLAALGEDCHVEWTATVHDASRALFAADRPAADFLVYPFFTMNVPVTEQGELVCEVSTLDDRRFVDVELFGNTGGHDAFPPRCFSAHGETLTATNAPGCAE